MKFYHGIIKKLLKNEVFVFGSNLHGFHGAGAAGYASFGISGNHWREFNYADKPNGWKGMWNVKGIGKGFQEGTEGKSYALATVTRAGAKKSLTLDQIANNIMELYLFATEHPELNFYIAYSNDGRSLNGYTSREIVSCFKRSNIPDNIFFSDTLKEMFL